MCPYIFDTLAQRDRFFPLTVVLPVVSDSKDTILHGVLHRVEAETGLLVVVILHEQNLLGLVQAVLGIGEIFDIAAVMEVRGLLSR